MDLETSSGRSTDRTALLTVIALVAFAANSWLCRAALRGQPLGAIDAASFTALRLGSGAFVLALLAASGRPRATGWHRNGAGSWRSAAALAAYALFFSFAYRGVDAGVGALTLFGAVQATMLVGAALGGHRPTVRELGGIGVALGGLVVLAAPGRATADAASFLGMVAAGISWAIYTLRGRGSANPVADTAGNFARTLPAAVAFFLAAYSLGAVAVTARGLVLATLSGAITSGLGYAVWYAALPGLGAARAGLVQLAVPVLAAAGGVALLDEAITVRLLVAAALVLGGIALAIAPRRLP